MARRFSVRTRNLAWPLVCLAVLACFQTSRTIASASGRHLATQSWPECQEAVWRAAPLFPWFDLGSHDNSAQQGTLPPEPLELCELDLPGPPVPSGEAALVSHRYDCRTADMRRDAGNPPPAGTLQGKHVRLQV
jgi:hypothetical protein